MCYSMSYWCNIKTIKSACFSGIGLRELWEIVNVPAYLYEISMIEYLKEESTEGISVGTIHMVRSLTKFSEGFMTTVQTTSNCSFLE